MYNKVVKVWSGLKFAMSLKAFTLAELLIALAILGVIAVFAIPKVLEVQQNAKANAIIKEAMATISQAYDMQKHTKGVSANTKLGDLISQLNYIKRETSVSVDGNPQNSVLYSCDDDVDCLKLHNGAILWFWEENEIFGGTTSLHALEFCIDHDGQGLNPAAGHGTSKSVCFFLYYNGRLTSYGKSLPNTNVNGSLYTLHSGYDPNWFKWN